MFRSRSMKIVRSSILASLALAVLAGCGVTRPYLSTDLSQVTGAYATIKPIYEGFKAAYDANSATAIAREFAREQRACRLVDDIDNRDTIDPNTNLFSASAALDTYCNDIESAYSGWRKAHGLSYDETLPVTLPNTYFLDGDYDMKQMHLWLSNPAGQCCPTPATPTG
jgi:hypothetical protein